MQIDLEIQLVISILKELDVYRGQNNNEILKDVNHGGMSYYMMQGSGGIKAEQIISGRGTTQTQPEYIERVKVDVVVKDHQVEQLISKITDRLSSELGGKIFVVDIPVSVDLMTKNTGEGAV